MGKKKQRLETLRSLYVDVFNKTTVGFVLVNKNGIIKDTNETFRKTFGYKSKSDLRDKHIQMCHINSTNYEEFQKLSKYILEGNSIINKEFQLLSAMGEPIWCEIAGTMLKIDDRMKEGGILWDIVDITEKVKTKELIAKQNQEFKKLNNSLQNKVLLSSIKLKEQDKILVQKTKLAIMGEMLDAVAHQWKQPLSVIKLSADELKYYSDYNQLDKEYLDTVSVRIMDQIDHLSETIDEFKKFLRPKDSIAKENIKAVVNSSIKILKDELIQNNIKIKFIGDSKIEARIIPNEFKHIIINLINNAKDQFNKHKIVKRVVTFTIEKDKKEAILKISDNAGGIPSQYLDKIFDANFSTKTQEHGTGIGLYMTKNILEKIGATIRAKNIKDGAQFIMRIPL